MRGYKVVARDGHKRLFSPIVSPDEGGIQYKVGAISEPAKDCGPLLVFTDLEAAREYSAHTSWRVYECRYRRSTERSAWYTTPSGFVLNSTLLELTSFLRTEVIDLASHVALIRDVTCDGTISRMKKILVALFGIERVRYV